MSEEFLCAALMVGIANDAEHDAEHDDAMRDAVDTLRRATRDIERLRADRSRNRTGMRLLSDAMETLRAMGIAHDREHCRDVIRRREEVEADASDHLAAAECFAREAKREIVALAMARFS